MTRSYSITRRNHTWNQARSEYPGEYALYRDASAAGVSLTGHPTREAARAAAKAIDAISSTNAFACTVVRERG